MFLHIQHFHICEVFTLATALKNLQFYTPKSSKIVSQTLKNSLGFFRCLFSGFSIDFGSILESFWGVFRRKNPGKN